MFGQTLSYTNLIQLLIESVITFFVSPTVRLFLFLVSFLLSFETSSISSSSSKIVKVGVFGLLMYEAGKNYSNYQFIMMEMILDGFVCMK